MDVLKTLSNIGIVPVIAIDDADRAVDLVKALEKGGLPAAEITFRTAAGQEAIKRVAKECPEILVGAGTVLTARQCDEAIEAGAKFIVAPGYFDEVVDHCLERGIPVLPGCATPSEMTKAVNAGLKTVKFFPAEASGGVAYLKSIAPVFPLNFMPTGGVNTANLLSYLTFDRIASVGGTWMVKKDLINEGRFEEITAITKEAVKTMLGFELRHVGINCKNAEEAERTAKTIAALFGFEYKPGNSSDFAGSAVECMKSPYLGTNGHIAIGTNSVDRAVYHLGLQGVEFDESTRKTDPKGKTKAIYLKGEFGGFAVHLVQK